MTKFSYTGNSADYPTLGFMVAGTGSILDGSLSSPAITVPPDARWSVYGGGNAETGITRYSSASATPVAEPADGFVLAYSDADNAYLPTDPAGLGSGGGPFAPLDSPAFTGEPTVNGEPIGSGGGGPSAGAGVRTQGYSVPDGSLARWDAYIRGSGAGTHANTQRDWVRFGDSTEEGVLDVGGSGAGRAPKARALAIADGITDGGRGLVNGIYDTDLVSGEGFRGYVSRTGWNVGADSFSVPGPNGISSHDVGDELNMRYKAPSNAIRIRCASNGGTGRLKVEVEGNLIGYVDPWVKQTATTGTYGETTRAFTGLPAGSTGKAVKITNVGGAVVPAPIQFRTAGNETTGGALAPGTYTYAATLVDATGKETALSPIDNQVVPAGTSTNKVTVSLDNVAGNVAPGITKAFLYRASGAGISNPASFQKVAELSTTGGSQVVMFDVGNTPGKVAPSVSENPVSDPANGGPKNATITVEFFRSTAGLTVHRAGYSNQEYPLLFSPSNSTIATAAYDAQTHLGLTTGLGVNGLDWSVEPAARPDARNPVLVSIGFGINDLNHIFDTNNLYVDPPNLAAIQASTQAVREGVGQAIRMARAAGADTLVEIPHLEYAVDTRVAKAITAIRNAILNTADAYGSAWVDLSYALGPVTTASRALYGGVHLTQVGYDAQMTYEWPNVLGPDAPR